MNSTQERAFTEAILCSAIVVIATSSQFSLIAALIEECTRKEEVRAPIVGLAGAGKTTLLEQAKRSFPSDTGPIPFESIRPTIGMNMGKLTVNKTSLLAWDVGGQMESLWPSYFDGAHALIFVVDASDRKSFERVSTTLSRVLGHDAIDGLPVLVVANKQDLGDALAACDVTEAVVLPAARQAAALRAQRQASGRVPSGAASDPATLLARDDPRVARLMERTRTVEASALGGEGVSDAFVWLVTAALASLHQE